jgi:hypothetical protein
MINITSETLVILYRHLEQINWSKYHKTKFEDIARENKCILEINTLFCQKKVYGD